MSMGEGDIEVVNVNYLTMLQHALIKGGRCQRTIRLKKGFPPKLDFPQHRANGGRGDRFQQIIMRCIDPKTFDALENRELFETLDGQDGTQLL